VGFGLTATVHVHSDLSVGRRAAKYERWIAVEGLARLRSGIKDPGMIQRLPLSSGTDC
jgi:hypothetical protein